jgi:hypothetical protein
MCICANLERFELDASVFRESQGGMESQACQAPQVTRYVDRLCLICISLVYPEAKQPIKQILLSKLISLVILFIPIILWRGQNSSWVSICVCVMNTYFLRI